MVSRGPLLPMGVPVWAKRVFLLAIMACYLAFLYQLVRPATPRHTPPHPARRAPAS